MRVSAAAQNNDLAAGGAFRRLVWRWIGHLLEVVLVGPVPNDHLGLEIRPAYLAGLPVTLVTLIEVMAAEGISAMVAAATYPGVREGNILMLIVADPVPAAFGPGQILCLAAEPAARLFSLLL